MAGVVGRWGDGTELPLVVDIVRSLHTHAAKIGSGQVAYLNLRSYPATLVFTAFAIGLTRAQRWKTLHDLFGAPIDRGHRDARRAVEVLFLHAWKGTDNDVWRLLEGLDRRKTPFSDHLLTLFEEWSKRFAGLTADIELVFERFELLGALAHLERNGKDSLRQELQDNSFGRNFAWMPVGRIGWHSSNATKLVEEIQEEGMKSALLAAGFVGGDVEFLDLFVKNFQRIAGRMEWS